MQEIFRLNKVVFSQNDQPFLLNVETIIWAKIPYLSRKRR